MSITREGEPERSKSHGLRSPVAGAIQAVARGQARCYGERPGKEVPMPVCKECGDEVDELVKVKVDGKMRKVCEDCADRMRADAQIAEESEGAVQNMMGFKGRR